MSSFAIKPETSVKELKILLLKISFGVLFVVFGILGVFSDVSAATIFEDDFEAYDLGSLGGQGSWVAGVSMNVVDDNKKTGVQAISGSGDCRKAGTELNTGTQALWLYLENGGQIAFQWESFTSGSHIFGEKVVSCADNSCDVYYFDYPGWKWVFWTTLSTDEFHSIEIEWELYEGLLRCKFGVDGEWSGWFLGYDTAEKTIKRLAITMASSFWVDDISEKGAECSLENCYLCEEWFECQVVGCCWYYQPWYPPPFDNYCDICEGECSYPLNCGLCATETTCEAAGCFWTGDYCTQFEWSCGPELACQFCDSQETCEAEGCNWNALSETCWYAVSTLPSSWSTYYDEYGGYETPAEFVNELAQTTGETLAVVSGLFEGFLTSFNSADALAKGTALGNVIPKGRGYLKVFDGLFGHYPIGETFVFILIFMLAIGLFRIARQLISLVKP